MKVKLISALRINGKRVLPSKHEVVIVDIDAEDFERLRDNGTVVKATKDELLLAEAKAPKAVAAEEPKADDAAPKAKATRKPKAEVEPTTEGGPAADSEL